MGEMDYQLIESKWQKKWREKKAYESNPDKREKFYLTAAFPYPNSPQHIGHARTYTTTDVYARFKRMQGKNVLLPMAFHVTGTPILAMAKRIAEKDEELLKIFETIYGIPRGKAAELTDPKELVTYFSKEIEQGMQEMGFSIDWRRKFYTFDPRFNKFIEWQFRKLKRLGFITKGSHPVPWCPRDNNAVGSHDTKGDVDPELGEYVLIKFKYKDGFLVAATFRPETIYGVTNVWFNPKANYVKVKFNGEKFVVSAEAAEKLKMRHSDLTVEEKNVKIASGEECENPMGGKKVPLYPASFVDSKNGSGIVMSVPAHAPYDYLALRDLGKAQGIIQVLKIEGFGEFPAKEVVEKMQVKDQNDPKAEEATKEVYRKEAHGGTMVVGKYKGEPVLEAKEKIKGDMIAEKKALIMNEIINGPVFCRCGALCGVKTVEDQWFIDYGNEEWKEKVRGHFAKMSIIPKKAIAEYEYTINWLKEKACARASGLGTKFPFDEKKMIESLSDSTIYMAYYTIAHKLAELKPEELDEKFFDYVLLGEGKGNAKMDALRKEFLYWYPLDSRHSGADLIHNHLTFFIFNHVAIFPHELWPRQIVTNGFVLMDGGKMSKSLGNILSLRSAVKKFGADVVRFSVVSGAELGADSDFNQTLAEGIDARIKIINDLIEQSVKNKDKAEWGKSDADKWLASRWGKRVAHAEELFEQLQLREVAQEIFYNTINDIRWYQKRIGNGKQNLRKLLEEWVLLVSPFMPHLAEELWEKLEGTKKGMVVEQKLPKASAKYDENAERAEQLVISLLEDTENILKMIKRTEPPKKISIYCASDWKRKVYEIVYAEKRFDTSMKKAMALPEVKPYAKMVAKAVEQYVKNVAGLSSKLMSQKEEVKVLEGAAEFLGKEFSCEFSVMKEEDAAKMGEAHKKKAEFSQPNKPSIFIE
ncbi:Leucine--tRNA ligase [Candidatus Gugararchaeum adminiculabundum]|nr:Leucine--tRNA ligase [Candidatus Gugararchaeum adminiculabundum]